MNRPSLSICIATLNRAPFLETTLQSLVAKDVTGVEIIVVDGGSRDRTAEVCSSFAARNPHLRYIRLEQARGVDRDYACAVEAASGEYCWLLADDDLLKPGALKAVMEAITSGYSLVIVNAEVRNADLSQLIDARRLPFEGDRVYGPDEMDRLLAETANYLSFIGSIVIAKDVWNSRDKEAYFGTEFVHMGVIFQAPLPGKTLAIAQPWIVIRYGAAQWSSRSFEIWMFRWPGLIWSFPHIATWAKERVVVRAPWRRIKTLLRYRAAGLLTPAEYNLWIRPQAPPWILKTVGWAIARSPGRLLNLIGFLYYRYFHASSKLELADIRQSPFFFLRGRGAARDQRRAERSSG